MTRDLTNTAVSAPISRLSLALNLSAAFIVAAAVSGCGVSPSEGTRVAFNGSLSDVLPVSTDVQKKNPDSGCPDNIRVTYKFADGAISIRTFEGGYGTPGVCTYSFTKLGADGSFVSSGRGISIAGLFAGNKMLDPDDNARNILPVVQGKVLSSTYTGKGLIGITHVTFEYVGEETMVIAGISQQVKGYKFTENRLSASGQLGQVYTTHKSLFINNLRDPSAPIFIGSSPIPDVAEFPSKNPSRAVKIEYLPLPQGSRTLALRQ